MFYGFFIKGTGRAAPMTGIVPDSKSRERMDGKMPIFFVLVAPIRYRMIFPGSIP